jgi:N-acetylglucosaminyldiphosphoundecaprenol N-acetyl-beta-D-mannosaminyltransferase
VIDAGRHTILGVRINAVDYETAVERIIRAAHERHGFAASALAVHGLMTGVFDEEQRYRLNRFDLLVPDGQPVRWALNRLYRARLKDRVYGPNLMRKVCARAAQEGLAIFFYGSTEEILRAMKTNLEVTYPGIRIAGMEASKFRQLTPGERDALAERIRSTGASMVMVGLGCPRQEVWGYEFRDLLQLPVLTVGAAFPFTAGKVRQAPKGLQNLGLEWAFRLCMEPRLWRRYLYLNPTYVVLVVLQALGILNYSEEGRKPARELLYG